MVPSVRDDFSYVLINLIHRDDRIVHRRVRRDFLVPVRDCVQMLWSCANALVYHSLDLFKRNFNEEIFFRLRLSDKFENDGG